jgi:hypothetical protein
MAYCAEWLRPQENLTVAVAQERAAGFDPALRAVMAWRPGHGGLLGHAYTQPRHLSGPPGPRARLAAGPADGPLAP